MKYEVAFRVTGRGYVEVEADSPEEARMFAAEEFCEYDCGNLDCVEWRAACVEGEDGSTWEILGDD